MLKRIFNDFFFPSFPYFRRLFLFLFLNLLNMLQNIYKVTRVLSECDRVSNMLGGWFTEYASGGSKNSVGNRYDDDDYKRVHNVRPVATFDPSIRGKRPRDVSLPLSRPGARARTR